MLLGRSKNLQGEASCRDSKPAGMNPKHAVKRHERALEEHAEQCPWRGEYGYCCYPLFDFLIGDTSNGEK